MKYKQSVYKTFALISQLGISILVPILLCIFIPLVIVGVLAGLRNAWVLARHANEDPEDKNKN